MATRWVLSSTTTRIAAGSRSQQLRLKVYVCTACRTFCMQDFGVSLGSSGGVSCDDFFVLVASVCVLGDVCVV